MYGILYNYIFTHTTTNNIIYNNNDDEKFPGENFCIYCYICMMYIIIYASCTFDYYYDYYKCIEFL